jgi:hypothetical protein
MKTIAHYSHPAADPSSPQSPDTAPGPSYVSCRDGPKFWLMSGPYALHADALAQVEPVRSLCISRDPWASFRSFGTVRMKPDFSEPGNVQKAGFDLAINPTT